MIKLLPFVCLMFVGTWAFAGPNPQEVLNSYKEKYPDQLKVILDYSVDVVLTLEEGEPKAVIDFSNKELMLKSLPGSAAKGDVKYSQFQQELISVEASSQIPDKNKYKTVKVDKFDKVEELSNSIFHDDVVSYNYVFSSVSEGVINSERHVMAFKDVHLLPPFYMASYVPTERSSFSIEYPNDIELDIQLASMDPSLYTVEEKKGKKSTVYTLVTKPLPSAKYEANAPPISSYIPKILVRVVSVADKGFLGTVDDLHNYYQAWLTDINVDTDPAVQAIVDSLVSPSDTDREKARKIFHWVQENIKYVAFEDGVKGFVPDQAKNVCTNRFGDCKGMSSILVNMMRTAGVESYYTWIGTRDIPYKYSEFPTPIVDNHMIAAAVLDGEHVFLDATGGTTVFGYPTSFIQGKEALIHKGEDKYEIVQVKPVPSSKTQFIDSIYTKLKGNTIHGEGVITMTGYYAINTRARLNYMSKGEMKEFIENLAEKGSNKFKLLDYELLNLEENDLPLEVKYSFEISDYAKLVANKVFLNPHFSGDLVPNPVKKDRELPLENDYKSINKQIVYFEIPEGYTVDYKPENITRRTIENDITSTLRYNETDSVYSVTYTLDEDFIVLDPGVFDSYNRTVKQIKNDMNESISLKKK